MSHNKRLLKVLEGITLILLSAAMTLNMGYVMRTINAAFIFIAGHGIYYFIALFIVQGFSLIIRGKMFLPKKKVRYLPITIILICALMLVSSIEITTFDVQNDDIIRTYVNSFNNFPNGYYAREFINIFTVPFGGGIIGYLLAFPFVLLTGRLITIIIASALLLIMVAVLLIPKIRRDIRDRKEAEELDREIRQGAPIPVEDKKVKTKREKKKKKTREEKLQEKYHGSFIEESDVFLHAHEVGDNEVSSISQQNEIVPLSFANFEDDSSSPIRTIRPSSDTSTLEKAQINLFGESTPKETTPFRNNVIETPVRKEEEISIEEYQRKVENPVTIIAPEDEGMEEAHLIDEAINKINTLVQDEKKVVEPIVQSEPQIVIPSKKEETIKVVTPPRAKPVEKEVEEETHPTVQIQSQSHIEWIPPSTEALATYQTDEQVQQNIDAAKEKLEICNQAFKDFKIEAEVVNFVIGPSITRLLIDYPSTGSIKAVDRVKLDIARRLRGIPIRFEETVPDTQYSGFEVPNPVKATVSFKEIFEALPDPNKHPTAIGFGKDITGKVVYADICEFPHMLVAGTSGSGKSVFINSIIATLISRTSPQDLKLVLVDPKQVEMNRYREEPHLLCPVINDAKEAKVMLEKMVDLMNQRYADFSIADCATNIKDYNYWAKENNQPTIPYIIIILDEYADLAYSCKEISSPLVVICAKARAAGIHVIVSTQRPSADVITGTVKANLNTRVALMAASGIDSSVILDEGGAETLLGNGDMLVKSPLVTRTGLARLQGCFIQPKETMYIVNYLKKNYQPEYLEQFLDLSDKEDVPVNNAFNPTSSSSNTNSDEEKYQWIKEWALTEDYVSMSKIQRSCSVGFNRAGKIVKRLQDDGVLSTISEGSNKGFKVLGGGSRFNEAPPVDSGEQSGSSGSSGSY